MGRSRVDCKRIVDESMRQVTFVKRKKFLLRKAMELSVLCDCDVALIVFSSSGRLCQFSSRDMESILERYTKACVEPHERHNNQELMEKYRGVSFPSHNSTNPKRKREESLHYEPPPYPVPPAMMEPLSLVPTLPGAQLSSALAQASITAALAHAALRPVTGLSLDRGAYPVSPRSEVAYEAITRSFQRLSDALHSNGKPSTADQAEADIAEDFKDGEGEGPSGAPGSATKRFRNLSIVVPDSGSTIFPSAEGEGGTAADDDPQRRPPGDPGPSSLGALSLEQLNRAHSGFPYHLALQSPGGLPPLSPLFTPMLPNPPMLITDGLSGTGRNTPEITSALPTPSGSGMYGAMDWPSPSPRTSDIMAGFVSDGDDGSGEFMADLVVTGRSLARLAHSDMMEAIGTSPRAGEHGLLSLGEDPGGEAESGRQGVTDIPLDV